MEIQCVTIDAQDPHALAQFWAAVLGWEPIHESPVEVVLRRPGGGPGMPDLLLLHSPDAKAAKNRLHLDLRPDDQDAEVARVESLGGRRVDIGQDPDVSWVVMADPEGNEFCILRALGPGVDAYEL